MDERSLAFAGIRELGQALRTGETTPLQLATFALSRLERLGPRLNAVVTVTRARALEEAAKAQDELTSGLDRGPLHGIPYGAKDLLATGGGIPTTWGAAPFRQQQFAEDAAVITRLRDAGAVLVAKLAMVELAGGFDYDQPNASFTGPGINPWDIHRWSSGSSSGSASAVAAGLVPFAIGSETWGSILSPAAACGLSGLRPTYGRVSRHGAMALSWSLDKIGPICRSADDCGLVLAAIAGADPLDADDRTESWRYEGIRSASRPFRLAVPRGLTDDGLLQPAVRERFGQAIEELRSCADIEEVDLPDFPHVEVTQLILKAETASAFEGFLAAGGPAGLAAPESRTAGYAGTTIPAVAYLRALRIRGQIARAWKRLLQPYDALVAPTISHVASKLNERFSEAEWPHSPAAVRDIAAAGNVAGLPAISVPSGFDAAGLPTAVAFLGSAHSEQRMLEVAAAYQERTTWHSRHPEW